MIVVDSNIIGYLYLKSERSSQVERVLRKDAQWAAPLLWRSNGVRLALLHYYNALAHMEVRSIFLSLSSGNLGSLPSCYVALKSGSLK